MLARASFERRSRSRCARDGHFAHLKWRASEGRASLANASMRGLERGVVGRVRASGGSCTRCALRQRKQRKRHGRWSGARAGRRPPRRPVEVPDGHAQRSAAGAHDQGPLRRGVRVHVRWHASSRAPFGPRSVGREIAQAERLGSQSGGGLTSSTDGRRATPAVRGHERRAGLRGWSACIPRTRGTRIRCMP